MDYGKERACAIEAVQKACTLCMTVQTELVSGETLAKKDRSPVTIADFGAQAVVNLDLLATFPGDPVVGEEDASQLRTPEAAAQRQKVVHHVQALTPGVDEASILNAIDHGTAPGGPAGRFWVLDPIDGTKGFLRGQQYAIALGLIEDGEVVLGVLGCPNLPLDADAPDGARGCIFVAVRGQGSWLRGLAAPGEAPIHVAPVEAPAEAAFCESVEAAHSAHDHSAQVAEQLGISKPPYRIDSQCKYAAIARGDASIYLRLPTRADYEEKIWDHAAGSILVTEAGGRVTDVRGQSLDFARGRTLQANRGVVATCGAVHTDVIKAVRAVTGL